MKTRAIKVIALGALLGAVGCAWAAGNGHSGSAGTHAGTSSSGSFHSNGGFRGGPHGHDGFPGHHHHHFHHGHIFIGGEFWWPWPGYPVYGGAAVFYDLGQPVWYYCANPPGYYPYVGSCPVPWQHVPLSVPAPDYDEDEPD